MSDRLALSNAIEDAGIPRDKAQRLASVIYDTIRDNVATKADLEVVRSDVRLLTWMVGVLYVPIFGIVVKLLHG